MDDEIFKTRKTLIFKVRDQHDEHAWEEFIEIYRAYIFTVIRRMNIPPHDAGDILQDVLLRLWKRLPNMDTSEIRRFRSYLATITKSAVLDFIRKQSRARDRVERAKEYSDIDHLERVHLPEIDKIAEQEWENYLANMALKNIEPSFTGNAMTVFRKSMNGMSIDVIADELDLHPQSVYRLRSRVKAKLIEEVAHLRARLE